MEVLKQNVENQQKRNHKKGIHLSLTDRLMGTLQICNSDLNFRRKETQIAADQKLRIFNRIKALSNRKSKSRNHAEEIKTLESKLSSSRVVAAGTKCLKRPTSKHNMRWLGDMIRVMPEPKAC